MSAESEAPDGGTLQLNFAKELFLNASKLAAKLIQSDSDSEPRTTSDEDSFRQRHLLRSNSDAHENGVYSCDRCEEFETRSKSAFMAHVCKGLASPIHNSTASSNITTTATTPTTNNNNNNNPATTNHNLIGMVAGLLKKEVMMGEAGMAMDAESGSASAVDALSMTHQEANNNNSNVINHNTGSAPSQNSHHRKLFECDVCNMKFSNGANMRRHKMRHTGVKPYECRICQKRFFRKDHLAEHFTTHTKTLPYHCPICNRGFQRQIAMRAHFQNEHVGQHDLVKTCPLCSYRAGTMKSLRVHFFNRHGIDLDNPGPGAPSSLLLALDSPNASQLLPQLVAAAAQAQASTAYSDSGDSLRSTDNGTPPMHFLTPHVELSTTDNNGESFQDDYNGQNESGNNSSSGSGNNNNNNSSSNSNPDTAAVTNGNSSPAQSPHSADSNSNAPTSSLPASMLPALVQSTRHSLLAAAAAAAAASNNSNSSITPSISLIPIKQEPSLSDEYLDTNNNSVNKMMTRLMNANSLNGSGETTTVATVAAGSTVNESAAASSSSSSLTSLIKLPPGLNLNRVSAFSFLPSESSPPPPSSSSLSPQVSPLKSLLREDLKRRINARASSRASRNTTNGNSRASPSPTSGMGGNMANSNSGGASNGGGASDSAASLVATTTTSSNGVITSTGPENDLIALNRKRNLQCLFCGIEFPDQTLYFLHKGCHSESNPWKCNICGEQMNNVYEFNSHLLSKSHQ